MKWLKLSLDLFNDEKIRLIKALPDGDSIIVLWIQLLCLAGRLEHGGAFYLTESVPYTDEMLSTVFGSPLSTVRLAVQTFINFGMMEVTDGVLYLTNWDKYQSKNGEDLREYNREAQRRSRAKRKALLADVNDKSMTSQKCQPVEREKEEEPDKDILFSHLSIWNENFPKNGENVENSVQKGWRIDDDPTHRIFLTVEEAAEIDDKLSYEDILHYFGVIFDCEKSGTPFRNHYKAIMKMAREDGKI